MVGITSSIEVRALRRFTVVKADHLGNAGRAGTLREVDRIKDQINKQPEIGTATRKAALRGAPDCS